jgi:ubiquinol-cytochrome c reductase cytochrome b subunit
VKSGAFFAMVFGILGLMGGLLQINPIWQMGPYQPAHISAGSQPDFYLMWTEGFLRVWPAWEFNLGRYTIPAPFWAVLFIGTVFILLMAWPFIERKVTGDRAHHNLLQRPRDVPVRTAIGAMAIAFYMVLTLSAMNDIIALKLHISLNAMTWIGRIGMVVVPPLVYFVAYRWAIALQRSDREVLEHGMETGILKRLPHGAYVELHQPLAAVPLDYQGAPVPKRPNKLGLGGAPGSGSLMRRSARRAAGVGRAGEASGKRITRLGRCCSSRKRSSAAVALRASAHRRVNLNRTRVRLMWSACDAKAQVKPTCRWVSLASRPTDRNLDQSNTTT